MNKTENSPEVKQPLYQFEEAEHGNKPVIFIYFVYDAKLDAQVRKLTGVKWSRTKKAWYVADNQQYRKQFGLGPKPSGKEVLSYIHPDNQPALQLLTETLQLKAYSESRVRTYRNEFAQLLYLLKSVQVNTLDSIKLRSYFLYCTNTLKLSENTLHSRINAVKFYFEQVLHREKLFFEIPVQRNLPSFPR